MTAALAAVLLVGLAVGGTGGLRLGLWWARRPLPSLTGPVLSDDPVRVTMRDEDAPGVREEAAQQVRSDRLDRHRNGSRGPDYLHVLGPADPERRAIGY